MPKRDIVKLVAELAEPIMLEHNVELVDIEFKKEGANWFLRLYIDKEGGVDLDDCQHVSESLSEVLDKEDPIDVAYFLEVSSPGIDRPLKRLRDFERFQGQIVEVTTYVPVDGKKSFTGKLLGLEGNTLSLEVEKKKIEIPYDKVSMCKLAVFF